MDKLILSVATTGSATSREQTPYVPITPEEIAEQAIACYEEGAAIVHIHVRDDNGRVTCDPERYARVAEIIRERELPNHRQHVDRWRRRDRLG